MLDPNKLLSDGTVALKSWNPSEDGKLLAYTLAEAGSDWEQWRVRDVATGIDLEDRVKWTKFVVASWAKVGSGFYYSGYDEPKSNEKYQGVNYFNKLFFHKLGDPQSNDQLIYEKPEAKNWVFDPSVTEDGRYLIIFIWRGGRSHQSDLLSRSAETECARGRVDYGVRCRVRVCRQ